MKSKSEISTLFPLFHKFISTQLGTKIHTIRSDNGKEYFNQDLITYFANEGILHHSSCVDTPQQNGVAERKNRHLLKVARSLLFQTKVPKTYWGEAALTAVCLINRMSSRVLQFQSPVSTLSSLFPNFQGVGSISPKLFGCTCYVHVHSHLQSKLDPRAIKCVFLGYSPTQKGYKCYHPATKRKYTTLDVTFVEHQPYFGDTYLQGESLGEDSWLEVDHSLSIPSVVSSPIPSASSDLLSSSNPDIPPTSNMSSPKLNVSPE